MQRMSVSPPQISYFSKWLSCPPGYTGGGAAPDMIGTLLAWGIRFQKYEILYYCSAGKKTPCTKRVIFGPKKCCLRNFLFQLFRDGIV